MSRNFRVGIVGATGIAGQQFVVALQNHPWFTITRLAASERSAGRRFGQALLDPKTGARRWWGEDEPAADVLAIPVENGDTFDPEGLDVVFSATEADVARLQEPRFVEGLHRPDPELHRDRSGHHAQAAGRPVRARLGHRDLHEWSVRCRALAGRHGARYPRQPHPLHPEGRGEGPDGMSQDPFRAPGRDQRDVHARERPRGPYRVGFRLARTTGVDRRRPAGPCGRAQCEARELGLPTAPAEWIKVHDDPFRPQPRLDRDNGDGMTTTVGRIREDNVLPNGVKYMLVSHNTRMGAAAGAVLVAEYLVIKNHIAG